MVRFGTIGIYGYPTFCFQFPKNSLIINKRMWPLFLRIFIFILINKYEVLLQHNVDKDIDKDKNKNKKIQRITNKIKIT